MTLSCLTFCIKRKDRKSGGFICVPPLSSNGTNRAEWTDCIKRMSWQHGTQTSHWTQTLLLHVKLFSFFFRNTVTLSEINHTVRRHYVGTVWSKCEVWREKKTKQGVQTESLSKKSFWLFTTCLNGSDESQMIVLHLA